MKDQDALTTFNRQNSSASKSGKFSGESRSVAASNRPADRCGFAITGRHAGKLVPPPRFTSCDWRGGSAHLVRFDDRTEYDFRFDAELNTIVLLDLYRTDGEIRIEGRTHPHVKDLRDRLAFMPRGCDFYGWTELGQASSFVTVRFTEGPDHDERMGQFPCRHGFDDHALRMVMSRLKAVLQDPSLDHPGYVDALCDLVSFELKRTLGSAEIPARKQGGLTARQVRIVTDYMDAHLSERITVADLAALVGLTRFHFIRSFKESTGLPPHQFMIHKRVGRAKDILRQSTMTIGEVAQRAGFRGSLQFARAFRRRVGVTPTRFRRDQHG